MQLGWVSGAACPRPNICPRKAPFARSAGTIGVAMPKSVLLSRIWLHTKLHAANLLPSSVLRHNPVASPLFASLLDPQVLERKFSSSVDAFNRRNSVQCSL